MKTSSLVLIVTAALVFSLCAVCAGRTITVNAAGGADYTSIQAAIADVGTVTGDEIQVAPGTYNEAIDFLGKAVRLYSSGAQDETTIDGTGHYHVVQCVSGEGAGTILEGFTITGGNANGASFPSYCGGGMYNFGSSPTVTNCSFNDNAATGFGGGMYNTSSSPTMTDCTFSQNTANYYGGGMYNEDSSPMVTSCSFNDDTASDSGGGMYNQFSSPTVTDCSFSQNTADYQGGGMCNQFSSPTVTHCSFDDNAVSDSGGGMYNYEGSPTVTDCTFSRNTAGSGGGMRNGFSSPTVTHCTFSENLTARYGGGMYNSGSSPTVTDCTFSRNTANYCGGGMINADGGNPMVTNCSFNDNTASDSGGGINNYSSSPTVINCTFYGNAADNYGGGMYNEYSSSPIVTNCILWGNTSDEIYNNSSTPVVTYCDVQGGYTGTGNINADPNFVDAAADDLRLSSGSPCIDVGNNFNIPSGITRDLAGDPRRVDGDYDTEITVDMGAYEFFLPRVQNVTKNRFYPTIQSAIDEADDGDQIEAAPGTYYEAINFLGKAVRLYSSGGPEVTTIEGSHVQLLLENFNDGTYLPEWQIIDQGTASAPSSWSAATGEMVQNSNIYNEPMTNSAMRGTFALYKAGMFWTDYTVTLTMKSQDNDAMGLMFLCQDSSNYYRFAWLNQNHQQGIGRRQLSKTVNGTHSVVYYDDVPYTVNTTYQLRIEVHGQTISIFINNVPFVTGGGSVFSQGSIALYCWGNVGTHFDNVSVVGRALHVVQCISGEDADTILEGFTITGGSANGVDAGGMRGGGMLNINSSPTVKNCIFTGNTAKFGGGMFNEASSPTVTDCTFTDNTAYEDGGGMFNKASSPTVTDCSFSGNSATYYNGGGIYNDYHSSPTVTHCTFTDNTACYGYGGGMYNFDSSPTVTNCILWNDGSEIFNLSGSPTITYSDIQGGYAGTGNINVNPLFVNAADGDLRLTPGSPCIDAGNNTAIPSGVFKDLAGKYRFADDPLTADTGTAGTTGRPVVDMGAYEYQGPATTSQNLLANGGFETGDATGWITNWGFGLSASPIQVHNGTYSGLTSNRTASWHGAWQSVKGLMDDGKTYRISGWVKLENADSDRVALVVAQTDSAGARYDGVANATAYGDRWTFLDGTYALDVIGQLSGLHIYFEGPAAGVNFYVDDASVTEVKSDLSHDGHVDLVDFSVLAAAYGLDCSTQDCGRANLEDYDSTIDTLDLAVLIAEWFVGVQ